MLDALLDLVLPRGCAGCAVQGTRLCPGCRALLAGAQPGPTSPDPCPSGLPRTVALGAYDGVLKQLLLAHKERGQLHLSRPLGQALARAVRWFVPPAGVPFVVCAVPSGRDAVRARGYDHARRLAEQAVQELRRHGVLATQQPLLAPARRTADQAGLSAEQRSLNLQGALRGRGAPAVPVVLVDDVVTTGATLVEATRALVQDGHQVLGAVVVGATRRHSGGRFADSLHPQPWER